MPIRRAINEFQLQIASATSAAAGATVTPGNNTYGTYVQLLSGAAVTDDAYGIWLNFNSIAVSAVARDCIAKVGFDAAGGTSYTDAILDLLCSCAGLMTGIGFGGINYFFPLRIPAGTSIAVAMSVNNATVGTGSAFCRLLCKPSHPEMVWAGSFVRTFGTTPASSTGTAITPNSAGSKSAYVQLGSALAETLWYWCLGVGCNNTAMSNNQASWDLAIGSSTTVNRPIISDQIVVPTAAEALAYTSQGASAIGMTGDLIFARAGGPTTSPTGMSAAAYAVGG